METRLYQDINKQYYMVTDIPCSTNNNLIYHCLDSKHDTYVRYIGDENDIQDIIATDIDIFIYEWDELKLISYDKKEQEQINITNALMFGGLNSIYN